MKSRNSDPESSDDEASLFRNAVRDVKPLVVTNKAVHSRKLPRPIKRTPRRQTASIHDNSFSGRTLPEMEASDERSFLTPGVSRKTLKQLRCGHWEINDQLDLHGLTRDEALVELETFLNLCNKRGFRCLQIIHGKGLNSKNREPILKTMVWSCLKQHNSVLAFCQANPGDGGSGATLVLLKTSMSKK